MVIERDQESLFISENMKTNEQQKMQDCNVKITSIDSVPPILLSLYERVESLLSFVQRHIAVSIPIQDEFQSFLKNTLIGSCAETCAGFSMSKNSEFSEIINAAYQILHEKADYKYNQLTLSEKYGHLYHDAKCRMQEILKGENLLFISNKYFEDLHNLLGDKLLLYLFTKCSLFELAKESCYIQRTGVPAHILYKEKICKDINPARNISQKKQILHSSKPTDDQNSNVTCGKGNRKRKLSCSVKSTEKRQRIEITERTSTETLLLSRKKIRRRKWRKVSNIATEFEMLRNRTIQHLMMQSNFSFSLKLPRYRMFCNKDFRCRFPVKHVFSHLKASDSDVKKLACFIFSCNEDNLPKILTNEEYKNFNKHLKVLLNCHRSCPFQGFLSQYCPLKLKRKFSSIAPLLEQHASEQQVVKFLRSVLCHVVPPSILGVKVNFRLFLNRIKVLVTRGKSDTIRLFYFTHKMKTKNCSWLATVHDSKASAFLLGKIIHWLLDYVISVLKGFFYITESGTQKKKLFFYRKAVWQKIQALCINEFLKEKRIKSVTLDEVKRLCDEGDCIGVSTIRFLAKPCSVRQILNLPKRTNMKSAAGSNLMAIRNVTRVFNHIKLYNNSIFGCGKSTLNEVYHLWKDFIYYSKRNNIKSHYCFVKVDLQDCFNNMEQEKLLQITKDVLEKFGETCYRIRKYNVLYKENGQVKQRYVHHAASLSDTLLYHIQKEEKYSRNTIIVDMGNVEFIDNKCVLKLLESYVKNCIFKIGRLHYKLIRGISQGGSLSTFLCNLYLADLERECLFDFGKQPGEVLLRMVDDFVFVTSSVDRARLFINTMLKGFSSYNLRVNPNKVIVNFPVDTDSVTVLKNGEPLQWLGLLIDTNTLNVSVDYDRYSGLSIGHAMSIDEKNPGLELKKKMLNLIVLQFLPITLDTFINKVEVVVRNLFEYFLLMAFRLHHIIRRWTPKRRMQNPQFLIGIIIQCANSHFTKCITLTKQNVMDFSLQKEQILWISMQAFKTKFEQHASMYQPLLSSIKQFFVNQQIKDKQLLESWKEIFKQKNNAFLLIFD